MSSTGNEVTSRFSEQRYAIPFGRYEGTRSAEPPANEVLVGRQRQRAQLLNVLFNISSRGAYLITGHRGSGKSTFVRYCVEQYRKNVYRRYLRTNVGRAFFWDRIGSILIVGLVPLLAAFLVSELLQDFSLRPSLTFYEGILIALLTLVTSYPLLAASEAFGLAFEGLNEGLGPAESRLFRFFLRSLRRLSVATPNPTGLLISFVVAIMILFLCQASDPAVFLAQLFVLLAWAYLASVALSFTANEPRKDPWVEDSSYSILLSSGSRRFLPLLLALGALISLPWWPAPPAPLPYVQFYWVTLPSSILPADFVEGPFVVYYWLVGAGLLGVGALFRGVDKRSLCRALDLGEEKSRERLLRGLASSARWSVVAGALLTTGAGLGFTLWETWWEWPQLDRFLFFTAVLVVGLCAYSSFLRWKENGWPGFPGKKLGEQQSRRKPIRGHPRVRLLLSIKALCLLTVGLQLSFPVARLLQPWCSKLPISKLPSPTGSLSELLVQKGTLWKSSPDDVWWLAAAVALFVLLAALEVEWIIRPFARAREDAALYLSDAEERAPADEAVSQDARRYYQRMAGQTFFWHIFDAWLPVLVIPVNLGFDALDYRRVSEAMLAGLKNAYERVFVHWSSPLVAARRFLVVALLMTLAVVVGDEWIGAPEVAHGGTRRAPCHSPALAESGPLLRVACALPAGDSVVAPLLVWSPFAERSVPPPGGRRESAAATLVEPPAGGWLLHRIFQKQPAPLGLDGLLFGHLLLLGFFYAVGRRAGQAAGLLPYGQFHARISRVLDSLSSRLREDTRPDPSPVTTWLAAVSGRQRGEGRESEPLDPRTVEQAFFSILADIQDAGKHLPFAARHRISPPLPEILFIFDELDKVGVGRALSGRSRHSEGEDHEPLDQERERSRAMNQLFADLKNLVSSAPARFLFIGGRNLHDEFLSDETTRRPLLTNIFEQEIYLPSLLVEPQSIREYLLVQRDRAMRLHRLSQQQRLRSDFALWVEAREEATFVQGRQVLAQGASSGAPLPILACQTGAPMPWAGEFYGEFCDFLAYRSLGNVRRLRALMEALIHPAESSFRGDARGGDAECDHLLLFEDADRFRVQLVANVYRKLRLSIEGWFEFEDDKILVGILYVCDFFMKFHRRAFSWGNLERVDELVHIHRAPDLRTVIERVVVGWSEFFLHPIRNGMYDYRFQSEFAQELIYLSRVSEKERATFNFTLDESQALKAIFQSRVDLLKEAPAHDFVAGLGELHEFDENYELARYYYRQAIAAVDEQLNRTVSQAWTTPSPYEVMSSTVEGLDVARRRTTWAVTRLRLMLQIAMTYEKAGDLESAKAEYRNARTLARATLRALLGWTTADRGELYEAWVDPHGYPVENPGRPRLLGTVKNLNLLFQATFAEAWVSEKMGSGVDTGPSQIDRELLELRGELPFARLQEFFQDVKSEGLYHIRHSNFALVMAELHLKAGDLYFFKGRQLIHPESLQQQGEPSDRQGQEGYLLLALYQYSISLHELRRFNRYRRISSGIKSGVKWETIERGGWADFVYRAAAGSLANLAEALLGRVSFVGLIRCVCAQRMGTAPTYGKEGLEGAIRAIWTWLESHTGERVDPEEQVPDWELDKVFPGCGVGKTALSDWFGAPTAEKPAEESGVLLYFGNNSDAERMVASLVFSLAAADLLEKAGYHESAARENVRVASTVSHYLWWKLAMQRLVQWTPEGGPWRGLFAGALHRVCPLLPRLFCLGVNAVDRAAHLSARSRVSPGAREGNADYQVGRGVRRSTLTLTCSLALVADIDEGFTTPEEVKEARKTLGTLVDAWTGQKSSASGPEAVRNVIIDSLERHSYPLRNRLHGLKLLVDHTVIGLFPPPKAEEGGSLPRAQSPELGEHVKELVRLRQLYDSDLHFTPLQYGLTLSLLCLKMHQQPGSVEEVEKGANMTQKELRELARQALTLSQEMYTQKRAYYEMLSQRYYLYDDFDDREIHYGHAIQMAGTELASFALEALESLDPRDSTTPRSRESQEPAR